MNLACSLFSAQAKIKDIEIVCDTQNVKDLAFLGDERRIGQILINLLSNALKFSNKSSQVHISSTEHLTLHGCKIEISVKDTGVGMTPEMQEKLFKAFSRGTDSISMSCNPNGNGLGLYICQSLANCMGGNITVKSSSGFGSEFTLTLTLQETDRDDVKESEAEEDGQVEEEEEEKRDFLDILQISKSDASEPSSGSLDAIIENNLDN